MPIMPPKLTCPTCGSPNAPDAQRCAQCRAALGAPCPVCGTPRPSDTARCPQCGARPVLADADDMLDLFQKGPNRRVGSRYLLRTTLSSGRISAVYRAEDAEHPGTEYAVKEFSAV